MHSLSAKEYFSEDPNKRVEFFNLLSTDKLVNAINSILKEKIHFFNTQLFFNPDDVNKSPYWHRDFQYTGIEDDVLKSELGKLKAYHIRIALQDENSL